MHASHSHFFVFSSKWPQSFPHNIPLKNHSNFQVKRPC